MSLEFLPGSTLGILGDGVTSRTLAQSAHNMGYNVAAYSTNPDAPVLAEADYRFVEQGNQLTEFESFMALSSMVTYTSSWLPANMITELQSARLPQGTELLELTDDHALLLVNGTSENPQRYQAVLQATDYKTAAYALVSGGYATDPGYAEKIIRMIETYNLNQYDVN